MSENNHARLDALIAQARRAEPPALTPLSVRRSARRAVVAAEASRRVRRQRWAFLCAACLALGMVLLAARELASRGTTLEVAANGRALRVALTSGDTLIAAPGTELELLSQETAQRRLRLQAGEVLFDVRRLASGQRFEVITEQARVRVQGTVFSVEVEGGRTIVRVYEGRVWVAERSLSAGQVWVSSGAAPLPTSDRLAHEGQAAAALRGEPPALIVSTLPDVSASPPVLQAPGADAGRSPASAAVPLPSAPDVVLLGEARAWLLAGDSERALHAAQAARGHDDSAWQLLEADALRALGRAAEAVDAYQRVAEREPALRVPAGYAAASLAFYQLHAPARALALLDALALDDASSPLRERASVLRVDVLLALDRRDDAQAMARRYLEREPATQVSRRMRALLR